ncbi:ABC transporter permease [Paenarthrobacter ureafaciens]
MASSAGPTSPGSCAAKVLSLREREFVEAARSFGASHLSVLFRQIIPNVMGVVLVYATMLIPTNISAEAALSFLGVGVKDPTPSWGQMLNAAQSGNWYLSDPWFLAVPGVMLIVTVLAFNLLERCRARRPGPQSIPPLTPFHPPFPRGAP